MRQAGHGAARQLPRHDAAAVSRAPSLQPRGRRVPGAASARTPTYAIWDDHEVRNDFAGPTEPLMPAGRQAFIDYWPLMPPADDPTRLYRRVRWGRLLEVFILDTRQYRSPTPSATGPPRRCWGRAAAWLRRRGAGLARGLEGRGARACRCRCRRGAPSRRDGWTGAGVFGLPIEDATGFATERDAILEELRARGVKNLVFIVADVHHAEMIRHEPQPGFVFHELIAGPLSASTGRPRPLDDCAEPALALLARRRLQLRRGDGGRAGAHRALHRRRRRA